MDSREDVSEEGFPAADPAMWRALVEGTEQCFFVASPDYRQFRYVSPALERLWGQAPGGLKAAPERWAAALHADDLAEVLQFIKENARRDRYEHEFRIVRPDGEIRCLHTHVFAWRDDGRDLVVGYQRDITEHKAREQGQQLARQIFEIAGEAIFVCDLHGQLLEVNSEACRLAKYSRAEMLRLRNVDIVAPDESARIAPELAQADAGAVVENRWLLLCSDKTTVPLDLVVQRLPGDLYLAIGRDLTEREKVLREVARARDQAETANRAKSRFLAAASHDLRQPIQAINLLRDALAFSELKPEQRDIADALGRAVHSLGELLNALLDISKLESGMYQAHPVQIGSRTILTRLDTEFAALAVERGLRFKLQFPFDDMVFMVDANLLHTLLSNLVGNAIKYTPHGGVLIAIRRRAGQAMFQVWDSGIGMSPEHLPQIFDEYFQVSNPQRDRNKGLGLGLAIVRRIARLLGTEVKCKSSPGRGSVFEFALPLVNHGSIAPASFLDAPSADDMPQLSGRRIAVIEDDVLVAEALRVALSGAVAEVSVYASGEAALADPAILSADYILSDLRLPDRNGIDCLNELQQRSPHRLKAALLTGDTDPGRIALARESGWALLFKPVELKQVLRTLNGFDEHG